eukprot:NODE_5645_length_1748_cov_2.060457.p1 GENE.NODE_5645_length_1748_cov_2.060457~~NODE_5645_length_1748_cov_2.060457.p1  ORF type:complete len:495 (-),score=130.78 NODE_5645_length_1748_cov_2.060457:179-1663(-)
MAADDADRKAGLCEHGALLHDGALHALTRRLHVGQVPYSQWPDNAQPFGLDLSEKTIADKLKAAGYATIGVGKWHLGMYNNASLPTHRGFDHFYGYYTGANDYFTHTFRMNNIDFLDLHDDDVTDRNQYNVYSTHLFTKKLIEGISGHAGSSADPLFVYYAIPNPHSPLEAMDADALHEACAKIINPTRRTYCGMVKAADTSIAQVYDTMVQEFPDDDIVTVIGGDNGGFVTFGGNNCPDEGSPSCLRGMMGSYYEGGIRNNALLCSETLLPNHLKGTTYSKGMVTILDWHTTFVGLAHGHNDADKPSDGYDMWDTLISNTDSPRVEFLANIDPCSRIHATSTTCDGWAVGYVWSGCLHEVCGTWKLISGSNTDDYYPLPMGLMDAEIVDRWDEMNKTWLYNLVDDPSERYDLSESFPFIVDALRYKVTLHSRNMVYACNVIGGTCYNSEPAQLHMDTLEWVPWLQYYETPLDPESQPSTGEPPHEPWTSEGGK